MSRRIGVWVVATSVAVSFGCATGGDIERLESQIVAVSKQLDDLKVRSDAIDQRAMSAEREAKAAAARAEQAVSQAATAADRADQAARTSEAIFKKGVRK